MIICLDIGNAHIYGGVFYDNEIHLRFRYPANVPCTSDVFALFLIDLLEINQLSAKKVSAFAISSVVPELTYSIIAACKKYFSIDPFLLSTMAHTGLQFDIENPLELGANRIANAIAATHHFPNRNIMIVSFNTATSICAISKENHYLGGAILPGVKLSMKALSTHAAKLLDIELITPTSALGKTTIGNIQSGLFYGQLGGVKEIMQRLETTLFNDHPPLLIATGDYAQLFEEEKYFSVIVPELVLHGLRLAYKKNKHRELANAS